MAPRVVSLNVNIKMGRGEAELGLVQNCGPFMTGVNGVLLLPLGPPEQAQV